MRRIVVIFTLVLLLLSVGKSQAGCYVRYYHGPRVVVCHRACRSVWIPGHWRWDWRCQRYFWIHGYWY